MALGDDDKEKTEKIMGIIVFHSSGLRTHTQTRDLSPFRRFTHTEFLKINCLVRSYDDDKNGCGLIIHHSYSLHFNSPQTKQFFHFNFSFIISPYRTEQCVIRVDRD